MSEPIKVGDLVYVARDCCGRYLGRIFVVEIFGTGSAECAFCKTWHRNVTLAADNSIQALGNHGNLGLIHWLRRIPPLGELDEVEHCEGIEA